VYCPVVTGDDAGIQAALKAAPEMVRSPASATTSALPARSHAVASTRATDVPFYLKVADLHGDGQFHPQTLPARSIT
jgi:hypothetical protein